MTNQTTPLRERVAEAIDPAAWDRARTTLALPASLRKAARLNQQRLAGQVQERMLEAADRVLAVMCAENVDG